MPNYENGLIYKLCCKDANITDIYVGSTTSLRHRKARHKSNCNNKNNFGYNCDVYNFIRENGGFENWDMVLVEYYKCETKLKLEKREREIIENLKPTLNKVIPTRTQKEWRDDNKEYVKERKKEYYENNKETIKEKVNEYCDNNKEKIAVKRKEKVKCECGRIVTKYMLNRHFKSIKHKGYIALKNNIDNI